MLSIKKLRTKVKGYRVGELMGKVAKKLYCRFVKVELVFSKTGPGAVVDLPVKCIIDPNAFALEEIYGETDSLKKAKQRLTQGDIMFVVYFDGVPASFAWVRFTSYVYVLFVKSHLTLPKDSLYIYDCVTFESYRGKSLYPKIINQIVASYDGRQVFIACQDGNRQSIRGVHKAGFKLVVKMYLIDLKFVQLTFRRRFPDGMLRL